MQVVQSVCILEYMWGGGQRASEEGRGQAITLQLPQGHALPHLHHCPCINTGWFLVPEEPSPLALGFRDLEVSFNFPFCPMPVMAGVTREEQGSDVVFRSFPERGTHSNTGPACQFLQIQRPPHQVGGSPYVRERKGSTN